MLNISVVWAGNAASLHTCGFYLCVLVYCCQLFISCSLVFFLRENILKPNRTRIKAEKTDLKLETGLFLIRSYLLFPLIPRSISLAFSVAQFYILKQLNLLRGTT